MEVRPAVLLSQRWHTVPGKLGVCELFFSVPLDHAEPNGKHLRLFSRSVHRLVSSATPSSASATATLRHMKITGGPGGTTAADQSPWLVYVPGGPGFGAREPQDYALTEFLLDKGYQILYFDHRGMGLSEPITAATIAHSVGEDPAAQAAYLRHFRADSAVRDLEAIRKCLLGKQKWSFMGQSYGGFVGVTYLSTFPEGLREVFTMGGLPPVTVAGPDDVYRRLVKKVEERNKAYYAKFPEDVPNVRKILTFLTEAEDAGSPVRLPGGGLLTATRFMQLGISFGAHGGLDTVHDIVLRAVNDLELFGFLTRPILSRVEALGPYDTAPLYALIHEPIYCQGGIACKWSAERVVNERALFDVRSKNEPVYFIGEMVLQNHFEDYPELKDLAPAAELLAETRDWPRLYDVEQLKRNEVPMYSLTYVDDMYVDFQFAQETAALIKGCKTFLTNVMYHDAYRSKTGEVMKALFALKEDTID